MTGMTGFVPPRFMDFMTEPPPPPPVRSPAPEPGFVHRAYVMPQRHRPGSRWDASWEITSTEHEHFVGTKRDCLEWARARCHHVMVYNRRTQDLERLDADASA
jgi:hypothetical protein